MYLEEGSGQALVRASNTVNGIENARSRSEKARLKMKMFLAVLISFFLSTADITSRFPPTKIYTLNLSIVFVRYSIKGLL